jgi:hypothetical protein
MDAVPETRRHWALLIGIDRYQKLGLEWHLDGCAHDVAILRDTLSRRFGFEDDQITVLLNEQATRKGILDAMEALVQRAEPGDEVVFFYSGHGSQQPDGEEGDEADGFDETLVPFDTGRFPHPNRDISDDEIYLWLLRLTAKTSFVTLIFDCCHSGTILRDGFAGKQRLGPKETRPPAELAARIPRESFDLLRDGEHSPAALQRLGENYVALVSCGSEETSNEYLPGEGKQIAHGALTYFLVRALMEPDFQGATWREVFERVVPQVTAHFRTQNPQLEGARDRQVFGAREIQPMTYIPVESCKDGVIVLGAGKACGLTEGSQWDVYAPATRSVEDQQKYVGQVKIFEVGVTSSNAREVTREAGVPEGKRAVREPIRAGMRAVECARSIPGVRLTVEIVAPPGDASAQRLAERMAKSRFLSNVNPGASADVRLYLLQPRSCCCHREDPAPMLGPIHEETWVPVGRDGALVAPAFPLKEPGAVESVVVNLEHVARLRGLAGIRNDDSPLRKLVDFSIYRLEGERYVEPTLKVRDNPVFFEDDRLVLKIRNRSEGRLFVYILDVGLTGKVSLVFPEGLGSHEPLERNHEVFVGLHRTPLKLFIPREFRLLQGVPEGEPVEGLETLKLFVTPSPASFDPLYQAAMRFPLRSAWGLNDLLDATFHGGYGFMRTKEDWTVIDRTFRLRSRKPS